MSSIVGSARHSSGTCRWTSLCNLLTTDGSTFASPAANYYRISRDPENATETTAQLFLGVRIQCEVP